MTTPRRWLYLILSLALLLRLAWSLPRPASDAALATLPDQLEYLSLARNLLHTGTLSFHDPRFDQTVYAYRTPGYPAFIALLAASPRAVRIAQSLLDTSTVLATYLLARRLKDQGRGTKDETGAKAASSPPSTLHPPSPSSSFSSFILHPSSFPFFAALLLALNPLLIYFTGLILTETLYTACLAWSLYLATLPRRRGWLAATLLLTLGVLVRPAGLGLTLLIPPLALYLNSRPPRSYLWRQALLRTAVAAAVLMVALGLWAERNRRILGQRVWLTTNEGITRYDGFNPRADGSSNQWFVKEMPRLRDMDEIQRNEFLSRLAAAYTTEHPDRVAQLALRKVARTWSPLPLSQQFGSPKYIAVALTYTLPFFLLTLIGLLLPTRHSERSEESQPSDQPTPSPLTPSPGTPGEGRGEGSAPRPPSPDNAPSSPRAAGVSPASPVHPSSFILHPSLTKLYLLTPALYLTLVHALSVGSLRYRLPADPPLAILAASAVSYILFTLTRNATRRPGCPID